MSSRRHRLPRLLRPGTLLLPLLALFLAGCTLLRPKPIEDVVASGMKWPAGWSRGELQTYDRDTLYRFAEGQAEVTLSYGFQKLVVVPLDGPDGARLELHVWQTASPADAFGLFTLNAGGNPVAIGNEASIEPGNRLVFWQGRVYVQLLARRAAPDEALPAIGKAVAAALPKGGRAPSLVKRLPREGEGKPLYLFFHEEQAIQNDLWLGGSNVLGLSAETDGVLAYYTLGGASAQLLLVQYPKAEAASLALSDLRSAQVPGMVAGRTRGRLLGVVFGQAEAGAAEKMLGEALR